MYDKDFSERMKKTSIKSQSAEIKIIKNWVQMEQANWYDNKQAVFVSMLRIYKNSESTILRRQFLRISSSLRRKWDILYKS